MLNTIYTDRLGMRVLHHIVEKNLVVVQRYEKRVHTVDATVRKVSNFLNH